MFRARRAAVSVFDRLRRSGARRIQYWVLTSPPALRARYLGERGARLWGRHVRAFISWSKKYLDVRFAYLRSHPCGDDLQIFAPHANIFAVQGNGKSGRLPVDAMRAAWAKILGTSGPVDIHVQYVLASQAGKLRHRVRYVERAFPGWSWRGAWARWYGAYPRQEPELEGSGGEDLLGARVCPICGKMFVLELPRGREWVVIERLEDCARRGRPPPARVWKGG